MKSNKSLFGFIANDQKIGILNYGSINYSSIPRQIIRTNSSSNFQVKDHQGKRLQKHPKIKVVIASSWRLRQEVKGKCSFHLSQTTVLFTSQSFENKSFSKKNLPCRRQNLSLQKMVALYFTQQFLKWQIWSTKC